jgi:Low affinity iron permease
MLAFLPPALAVPPARALKPIIDYVLIRGQMTANSSPAEVFRKLARNVAESAGSAWAFLFVLAIVIIWVCVGPYFRFSETLVTAAQHRLPNRGNSRLGRPACAGPRAPRA